MRNTRINKAVGIIAVTICLCLSMQPEAWAGGVGYVCSFETWPGGARSKVKIAARLPKGKYYAIVLTGDGMKKKSKPKATSGRKQLEFEFDSNLGDVVAGGKTQIDQHFNKSLSFTAQIRVTGSNRLVADTRRYRSCDKIEDDGDPETPTTPPAPTPPPPCRIDDNPSPDDPNDCSGRGRNRGGSSGGNSGSG